MSNHVIVPTSNGIIPNFWIVKCPIYKLGGSCFLQMYKILILPKSIEVFCSKTSNVLF